LGPGVWDLDNLADGCSNLLPDAVDDPPSGLVGSADMTSPANSPAFRAPGVGRPATAETRLQLKVTSAQHGDTFTGINKANEKVMVRLGAVNAPELSQPCGQASRKALGDKIFGKTVMVLTKKHDQYGRTIGQVLVDKRDTNLELLEEAAVWHY
jgi:endonuclease YncB( thermonuclease family)